MKNLYKQLIKITLFLSLIVVAQQAFAQQKVLVIISSHQYGYWLPEVVTPVRLLKDVNIDVEIASPYGGIGRGAASKKLSALDKQFLPQIQDKLNRPKALRNIDSNNYDAVYVAGGAGPMLDLYKHPEVNRIVSEMYLANKPVSADCHGPAALAGVKLPNGEFLVKGKKLTAKSNAEEGRFGRAHYPFFLEDKFNEIGALYSAAEPSKPWVVQDGNLLTGQNPASVEPLTKTLIKMLKTDS